MMSKVLVVEDDEDLRTELSELLQDEGYTVLEAGSGREALTLLEAGERPELILLDQMMPAMNGSEFRSAQLADETLRNIPVVLMTASAEVERLTAELRPAATLRKPMQVEHLLSTVKRVLARPN
jgi:CheY-like chemotaxis protein